MEEEGDGGEVERDTCFGVTSLLLGATGTIGGHC